MDKGYILISVWLVLCLVGLAGWLTHIFTCFATEAWGFLIAGAIFFPVGILHGFYLWFM